MLESVAFFFLHVVADVITYFCNLLWDCMTEWSIFPVVFVALSALHYYFKGQIFACCANLIQRISITRSGDVFYEAVI